MTSTSDDWNEAERHPLDEPRPAEEPKEAAVPSRRGRGLGANRHLASVLIAVVALVAAYGALDYGLFRAAKHIATGDPSSRLPDQPALGLAVAAACMLVAALAGRISGMGPLVAGLVLGAAPSAWVYLDYGSFVRRLDDVPEMWDNTTFGIAASAFAVFPVVAGLLIGAGLAGRWRRQAATS